MFEETNQTAIEETSLPDAIFEETETEVTADTEDSTETAETLRIKYNGEERSITLDEARTLAQKGMNYDHVLGERDRNREAYSLVAELAKSEGKTVEEYVKTAQEKLGGEAASPSGEQNIENWQRLFRDNPDLIEDGKPNIPSEVYELVRDGFTPSEAYFKYRTQALAGEIKMLKDSKNAGQKSVGSVTGVAAAQEDDFLSGFSEF